MSHCFWWILWKVTSLIILPCWRLHQALLLSSIDRPCAVFYCLLATNKSELGFFSTCWIFYHMQTWEKSFGWGRVPGVSREGVEMLVLLQHGAWGGGSWTAPGVGSKVWPPKVAEGPGPWLSQESQALLLVLGGKGPGRDMAWSQKGDPSPCQGCNHSCLTWKAASRRWQKSEMFHTWEWLSVPYLSALRSCDKPTRRGKAEAGKCEG